MVNTPDIQSWEEPDSLRSPVGWTDEQIDLAESYADAGNFSLAAMLCDDMLADDRVFSATRTLRDSVLGAPLTFDGKSRPVKALETQEDYWRIFEAAEAQRNFFWGFFLGVSLTQRVWKKIGNREVPVMKTWNPRHLRWDSSTKKWKVRVTTKASLGLDYGHEIAIEENDPQFVLFTPYGEKKPAMFGPWRAAARAYLTKHLSDTERGHYLQRQGGAFFVAETDGPGPGGMTAGMGAAGKEFRTELAARMRTIRAGAGIAPPPGIKIRIVESMARAWEAFDTAERSANRRISIAILAQNLGTEVDGSVGTGATFQENMFGQVRKNCAESLSTWEHDKYLAYWADANFGKSDLAPWPLRAVLEEKDQLAEDQGTSAFADGITKLKAASPRVDVETMLEERGIPLLAEAPPAPAPAPPADHQAPPTDPTQDPPADPQDPPQDGAKAFTKSGLSLPRNSGVVRGQRFVDDTVDAARKAAAATLDEDLAKVLSAIESAGSFEEAEAAITEAFKSMRPSRLQRLVEQALTLADRAGRVSLEQDRG